MTHQLVVTTPFLNFVRGDIIADATKIDEVMATEYRKFVTKVIAPNTSKG
jgi:hypothetical protein